MKRPERQILMCGGYRTGGGATGTCARRGSLPLAGYLQSAVEDRGMGDVVVTLTGCMNLCEKGPVVVIQPDNLWYGGIEGEEDIDEILDALLEGRTVERLLL
ncbi:(2Fe-2S) ferredoxin domain-containing protein [Spirochaeta thermophila]|uniref:Ferredoxin, 2Fe-2S n=1 Tax=Winmispira thermophila (strain ATCC 49972 / DSM 6192 / RI 19.B1) TaxID=665571 RepID=E0RPC4_WINT6|nr:(2Fe-2S) ferredoxin domain-containing protein [Spirochaeta thermophila]ADN01318.1 hypothetical protein STHERM_c03450 [Spirochaeta thermophila DSM 6192]